MSRKHSHCYLIFNSPGTLNWTKTEDRFTISETEVQLQTLGRAHHISNFWGKEQGFVTFAGLEASRSARSSRDQRHGLLRPRRHRRHHSYPASRFGAGGRVWGDGAAATSSKGESPAQNPSGDRTATPAQSASRLRLISKPFVVCTVCS